MVTDAILSTPVMESRAIDERSWLQLQERQACSREAKRFVRPALQRSIGRKLLRHTVQTHLEVPPRSLGKARRLNMRTQHDVCAKNGIASDHRWPDFSTTLCLPHVVHFLRSLTVLYARFIDALNAHSQLCFLRSLARQALKTKQSLAQAMQTCANSS